MLIETAHTSLDNELEEIAGRFIDLVTQSVDDVREGMVMTVGPAPYRRIDCDGRALAYIRTRPRKAAVRIDVSGLWITPYASSLKIPSATGSAALLLRGPADVIEAGRFVRTAVETTRAAYKERRILSRVQCSIAADRGPSSSPESRRLR